MSKATLLSLSLLQAAIWALAISAIAQTPVPTAALPPPPPMLKTNPLTDPDPVRPSAKNYAIRVNIINHGQTGTAIDEALPRFLHATEKIYSQCENINFHIHVQSMVSKKFDTEADDLVEFPADGALGLGERFTQFFTKFPNSNIASVITIHLTDFFSKNIRQERKAGHQAQNVFGQAFVAQSMDNLYKDIRSDKFRNLKLSEVGGNTVFLGMDDVLKFSEGQIHPNSKRKIVFRSYRSSLLAHEIGHIVFEVQNGKAPYNDHYCPGIGSGCPEDNLMSNGGYEDLVYLRFPERDQVIGYNPLPKLEKEQCEALIKNPLVRLEP